jgi:hypothetical protein
MDEHQPFAEQNRGSKRRRYLTQSSCGDFLASKRRFFRLITSSCAWNPCKRIPSRPSTTTETNFDPQGGKFYAPLDRHRRKIIPREIGKEARDQITSIRVSRGSKSANSPGDPTTREKNKKGKGR